MDQLAFCPSLQKLYAGQPVTGRTGRTFAGSGALSTPNNLSSIRRLQIEHRPERTLEIGMALGGSALTIAQTHSDLGFPASGQHFAIDPFQRTVYNEVALILLERAGLAEYVTVSTEPSALALASLVKDSQRFGLIYVDGSHLFEDVFVDVYFCARLLPPGGILMLDDSSDRHVRKALRFVRRNWQGILEPVERQTYADESYVRRFGRWVTRRTQLTVFQRGEKAAREWDAAFHDF